MGVRNTFKTASRMHLPHLVMCRHIREQERYTGTAPHPGDWGDGDTYITSCTYCPTVYSRRTLVRSTKLQSKHRTSPHPGAMTPPRRSHAATHPLISLLWPHYEDVMPPPHSLSWSYAPATETSCRQRSLIPILWLPPWRRHAATPW